MITQLYEAKGRAGATDLLGSLELALAGVRAAAPASDGPLGNPRTAAAFADGSSAGPVQAGEGLWAILRVTADGSGRVLCVHNVSESPRTFDPAQHLHPEGAAAEPAVVFLTGACTTIADPGGNLCELAPHTYVWLGRFTDYYEEYFR